MRQTTPRKMPVSELTYWGDRFDRLGGADFARPICRSGVTDTSASATAFGMMEDRLIVAMVAQRWQFSLEANQEAIPVQLVTLLPKNGIRMKLTAA